MSELALAAGVKEKAGRGGVDVPEFISLERWLLHKEALMKAVFVAMSVGLLLLMTDAAQAQTKTVSTSAPGTITLPEQRIVGRFSRPLAAVDVARVRPHVAASELRQPLVDRIDDSATKAPF